MKGALPTTRTRRRRQRTGLPDALARVLAGEEVEETPEAREAVIGAYFFAEHPELQTPDAQRRLAAQLDAWRGN